MVAVYVPEVGAEDCEILMVEKDWFDDGMNHKPLNEIYVTYDDYAIEVEGINEDNARLNDDLWFKNRDLEMANERIEELAQEKGELEEKVAELEDTINDLKDELAKALIE